MIVAAIGIAASTAAIAAEKQPASSLTDLGMTFERARKLSLSSEARLSLISTRA
jgi:hypothetical protein